MKTLTVCSITNWIPEDFKNGLNPDEWNVVADKGLYLPISEHNDSNVWWMPTEHAVKLAHSGFKIPFTSPGSQWLSTIPESLTRRKIITQPYSDISTLPNKEIWVKPAEFKHQSFFAGLYTKEELEEFSLPGDSMIQWTETILDIEEEYRFFVLAGEVIGGSVYLANGITYYDGALGIKLPDAYTYASNAVKEIGSNQPNAYVLDIAYDKQLKDFLVLEGNPAFSSAIYGVEPKSIIDALYACSHPNKDELKWLWKPDPYLIKKFSRMVPLQNHPAKR